MLRSVLYASHTACSALERAWEFSVVILLTIVRPGILLVSTYGLCVSLSIIIGGGWIGAWLDRTPRLKAIRIVSISRNLTIALAAGAMYYLVLYKDGTVLHKPLLVLVHLLGATAGLGEFDIISRRVALWLQVHLTFRGVPTFSPSQAQERNPSLLNKTGSWCWRRRTVNG